MPTKLTPFTTRPASTSRQGMTASRPSPPTPDDGQRAGDVEAVLVEGPSDDRPGEPPTADGQPGQGGEVVERADAAARHDVDGGGGQDRGELVEVGAVHRAVAADLGDHERHAEVVEPLRQLDEVDAGVLGP